MTQPYLTLPVITAGILLQMQNHFANDVLSPQRKAQDRRIDRLESQLSPVTVGPILTPPSSTEKPANH